jgi:hypothetical protein
MLPLLTGLPGRIWTYVAAVLAALAAGAWLLLIARQAGRDAERAAQATWEREAVHARMEAEGGAARAVDPAAELLRRWGR